MGNVEYSPIKKLSDLVEHVDDLKVARKFEQEFPGKIAILPPNSTIYHWTRDLNVLLNRNRFDYTHSNHDGAFFFTDLPIPDRTNCQIAIPTPLVFIERETLFDFDYRKRFEDTGKGKGVWEGAMNLGLDGRITQDKDAYTMISEEQVATEIVIFKRSLPRLGKITPYMTDYPVKYKKVAY